MSRGTGGKGRSGRDGSGGRGSDGGGSAGHDAARSGGKAGRTRAREAKTRGAAARARVAEMRAREAARKRRRNWLAGIGAAVVVIIAAVAITLAVSSNSGGPAGATGGTPKLKLTSLAALGTLKPLPSPGPNGPESTPTGRFIASGSCFYWLHTHADGIIHIESPVHRTYTLGDFFGIWGQPLGPDQVGPAHGPVTAIYNGQVYRGNPRNIPLEKHAQIQLEVGKPLISPASITFPNGL